MLKEFQDAAERAEKKEKLIFILLAVAGIVFSLMLFFVLQNLALFTS